MHDGGGNRDQDLEALPRIIDRLHKKGYTFVTIDELLASDKDIPRDIARGDATMPEDAAWPTEVALASGSLFGPCSLFPLPEQTAHEVGVAFETLGGAFRVASPLTRPADEHVALARPFRQGVELDVLETLPVDLEHRYLALEPLDDRLHRSPPHVMGTIAAPSP
jgi:hypothetical protein